MACLPERASGDVAEWSMAHAWKVCIGETLSWVRIPPSPPQNGLRDAGAIFCGGYAFGSNPPGSEPKRSALRQTQRNRKMVNPTAPTASDRQFLQFRQCCSFQHRDLVAKPLENRKSPIISMIHDISIEFGNYTLAIRLQAKLYLLPGQLVSSDQCCVQRWRGRVRW